MSRFTRYLDSRRQRRGKPIRQAEEVAESSDNKIDQDHPGFPHGQSSEQMIRPRTTKDQQASDPVLTDRNRPDTGKPADDERLNRGK